MPTDFPPFAFTALVEEPEQLRSRLLLAFVLERPKRLYARRVGAQPVVEREATQGELAKEPLPKAERRPADSPSGTERL